MKLKFEIHAVSYSTQGEFKISRTTVRQVDLVEVHLSDGQQIGRGECRPYARYNDTVESVTAQLESVRLLLLEGDLESACLALPPGPALNALDCARLDLKSKQSSEPVWKSLGLKCPQPRETAFTLSWDRSDVMAQAAKNALQYKWLKLKIGEGGLDRVLAVAAVRPDAKLILDANEALTAETLPEFLKPLSGLNIALIEQPLPAEHSSALPVSSFPICADEGLHTSNDLKGLWAQGYRAVNVKLDKCGGLTEGVALMREAREMGFLVMAGCMVSSSLSMAPMMIAESLCDVIDLDGPLLLSHDIADGLQYEGPLIQPPARQFWG